MYFSLCRLIWSSLANASFSLMKIIMLSLSSCSVRSTKSKSYSISWRSSSSCLITASTIFSLPFCTYFADEEQGPSHNLWGKHLPMASLINVCKNAKISLLGLDDLNLSNLFQLFDFISFR